MVPLPISPSWRSPTAAELRSAADPRGPQAYLTPFRERTGVALTRYLAETPGGCEGVLAVLNSLDQRALLRAAGSRERVVRDCERFAIAVAAEKFGSSSVFVGPNRRKSTISSVRWPNALTDNYLAIRVSSPPNPADRILLDSSVVRSIVHNDPSSMDLNRLLACKQGHPISLPLPTCLELAVALVQGRMPFSDWTAHVGLLDQVLDPVRPTVTGIASDLVPAIPESHCRAGWALLRHSRSVDDLRRGHDFVDEKGVLDNVALDPDAEADLSRFRAAYLTRQATFAAYEETVDVEDVVAGVKFNLELKLGRSMEGADLEVRCSAVRAREIVRTRNPPGAGRRNDAIDGALLGVVEVGILCTADRRLKAAADGSTSFDAWRVMLPTQLLEWLGSSAF